MALESSNGNFYQKLARNLSGILELVGDIGIILNDFANWFYSALMIWVKNIWVENFEIQPRKTELLRKMDVFKKNLFFEQNPHNQSSLSKSVYFDELNLEVFFTV